MFVVRIEQTIDFGALTSFACVWHWIYAQQQPSEPLMTSHVHSLLRRICLDFPVVKDPSPLDSASHGRTHERHLKIPSPFGRHLARMFADEGRICKQYRTA